MLLLFHLEVRKEWWQVTNWFLYVFFLFITHEILYTGRGHQCYFWLYALFILAPLIRRNCFDGIDNCNFTKQFLDVVVEGT